MSRGAKAKASIEGVGELNELLAETSILGGDKPVAVMMSLHQLHILLVVLRGTLQLWSTGKLVPEAVSELEHAIEPLRKAHEQVRVGAEREGIIPTT